MDSEPAVIPYCQRIYIGLLPPPGFTMGGVYPYSLFHDTLRREREGKGERKGKGKGKGKREREREKTDCGFVITESFSYLCMCDRYLDRQALSPCT